MLSIVKMKRHVPPTPEEEEDKIITYTGDSPMIFILKAKVFIFHSRSVSLFAGHPFPIWEPCVDTTSIYIEVLSQSLIEPFS